MILGEKLSSPPQTPIELAASFQPSPREPAYTAMTTYKPAVFYPQKKQRTAVIEEGSVRSRERQAPLARLLNDTAPTRYAESSNGTSWPHRPSDGKTDVPEYRRYSVQMTGSPTQRASDPSERDSLSMHYWGGAQRTEKIDSSQHYYTPDQTPTTEAFNRDLPPTATQPSNSDHTLLLPRALPRRPSYHGPIPHDPNNNNNNNNNIAQMPIKTAMDFSGTSASDLTTKSMRIDPFEPLGFDGMDQNMLDASGEVNWESWDELVRQFGMDVDTTFDRRPGDLGGVEGVWDLGPDTNAGGDRGRLPGGSMQAGTLHMNGIRKPGMGGDGFW
ncbi:hypothetical protein LTR62_007500 [Meristemomyces frigidus]|uniref:Uncharacterized protein n=1 Tax=Meristemomyces frigidus TaxID=1508187 RepID=A0AAN7TAY2_9PEZI|nr:hypothetical protein LTR62_007500 [Meristemomyces frigidus]